MRQSERMDESVCNEELRDIVKVADTGGRRTGVCGFCRIMDELQRNCVPVRGGALVEVLEGRGFIFWRVHFQLIYSFRSHCCPGIDLAFNINEYQEYLLGGS